MKRNLLGKVLISQYGACIFQNTYINEHTLWSHTACVAADNSSAFHEKQTECKLHGSWRSALGTRTRKSLKLQIRTLRETRQNISEKQWPSSQRHSREPTFRHAPRMNNNNFTRNERFSSPEHPGAKPKRPGGCRAPQSCPGEQTPTSAPGRRTRRGLGSPQPVLNGDRASVRHNCIPHAKQRLNHPWLRTLPSAELFRVSPDSQHSRKPDLSIASQASHGDTGVCAEGISPSLCPW